MNLPYTGSDRQLAWLKEETGRILLQQIGEQATEEVLSLALVRAHRLHRPGAVCRQVLVMAVTIGRNLAVDYWRKGDGLEAAGVYERSRFAREHLASGQRVDMMDLDLLLARLPEELREAVLADALLPGGGREHAAAVGLTEPAFKSRLYQARRRLEELASGE